MRKQIFAGSGSIVSAFFASICCLGPPLFAFLGLGSIGFSGSLGRFRLFFVIITFALLGTGFYLTYRRKNMKCEDETNCDVKKPGRWNKIFLWISLGIAILFLIYPYIS
ncbi:MAG: mercuric transporter MerT family protein [Fidelibacterota bacterium]